MKYFARAAENIAEAGDDFYKKRPDILVVKSPSDGNFSYHGNHKKVIFIDSHHEDILDFLFDSVVDLRETSTVDLKEVIKFFGGSSEKEVSRLAEFSLTDIAKFHRPGRPFSRINKALERSLKTPETKEIAIAGGITVHDLEGYGEAKKWAIELHKDLIDWKCGEITWEKVDKGLLLSGPPGCGKTTFARAVATTCGVELIDGSVAKWQSAEHLGDMLKAMRKDFERAKKAGQCIFLIDEFDSIGSRDDFAGEHKNYSRQVVNAMLKCIDGAGGREGVVIIGATNNPSKIDPALRRPGRLDCHIEIQLADERTRKQILGFHLGKQLELGSVLDFTEGWNGADLEQRARDAKRKAHRERQEISVKHVISCLPPTEKLTREELYRVAVHEVGHALVCAITRCANVLEITIKDRRVVGGVSQSLGGVLTDEDQFFVSADQLANSICVRMAGIAAEQIFLGEHTSGSRQDLSEATNTAHFAIEYFGFSDQKYSENNMSREYLLKRREADPELRARISDMLNN